MGRCSRPISHPMASAMPTAVYGWLSIISRAAVSNEAAVFLAATVAASPTFEACRLASPTARSKPRSALLLIIRLAAALVPPMASSRRTMRCISNKNTDGERNRRRSVRVFFHEVFQVVVALKGNISDLLSTILGNIHGLTVRVFRGACGLVHQALCFSLNIPCSSAHALLHFAADVANATREAIIVHRAFSGSMCITTDGW
jgi:hypothetical protein